MSSPKKPHKHKLAERGRTDPKSEYYVPNDPDNRPSAPDCGTTEGPPYTVDYESLAYADSVRVSVLGIGHKDPLQSVELLVAYLARVHVRDDGEEIPWSRERKHCNPSCRLWDVRGGWGLDAKGRPPGVHDPDSCDGCLLSKLDAFGEDPKQTEDRLYNEWAELKVLEERNVEQGRHAQEPAEKKRVTQERKRITARLATARGACELAGFDPAKRRRRLTSGIGEQPELAQHHDREREFNGWQRRRDGGFKVESKADLRRRGAQMRIDIKEHMTEPERYREGA